MKNMKATEGDVDWKILLINSVNHWVEVIAADLMSGDLGRMAFAGFMMLILVLFSLFFLLKAAAKAFEVCIKVFDAYNNGPLKFVYGNEKKRILRRQQQFCSVLDTDLAAIAKAENWNDLYFTDLEAEVEIEGEYYSSRLDKFFKRKLSGIRRVPSLISAINSSSERTVLLVGEPGSGKSVALRHLAKQIARKGMRSKNQHALIPLYLNLRELQPSQGAKVDADEIQKFVLDNIRRGDSDTSAYVKENWAQYKEKGKWIFLFDSFDEIPAVLHSATGSQAIRVYSQAIRQFLDGMGNCRGVLASREYKGPEALPWKKFRVLPLNSDRQIALIKNSFLENAQMDMIQKYLASDRSKVGHNPLFLSLLCRFIRDVGKVPANDHELLSSHLHRLVNRDRDYTLVKFGFTPDELLSGATKLALAFGTNLDLSLAPKVDEIQTVIGAEAMSPAYLQRLISALVDVKVGRNDVPTAEPGDRRFAFAHRRYQETLFANHIAKDPAFIGVNDLLLNDKWREYTVTVLQTQPASVIVPILEGAKVILDSISSMDEYVAASGAGGANVGYFRWSSAIPSMLELLQEGMARRLDEVPEELSLAILKYLEHRWVVGEDYDRYSVIKYGGLLPHNKFIEYLFTAFSMSSPDLEGVAFRNSVFLRGNIFDLDALIRRRLAKEILSADSKMEFYRLSTLAEQLPESMGARTVVRRCSNLRPIFSFMSKLSIVVMLPNFVIGKIVEIFKVSSSIRETVKLIHPGAIYKGGADWIAPFPIILCLSLIYCVKDVKRKVGDNKFVIENIHSYATYDTILAALIFVVTLISFFILIIAYSNKASPANQNLVFWFRRTFEVIARQAKNFWIAVIIFAIGSVFPLVVGKVVFYIATLLGLKWNVESVYLEVGLPSLAIIFMSIGIIGLLIARRRANLIVRKLHFIRAQGLSDQEIFLESTSVEEVIIWLNYDDSFLTRDEHEVRSMLALLYGDDETGGSNVRHPLLALERDSSQWSVLCYMVGQRVFDVMLRSPDRSA
jgi:hypothetical protein